KAFGAGRLAWPGPIGLQVYTVRSLYAKNPLQTLKEVAAVGYKTVELAAFLPPHLPPAATNSYLRQAGLKAIGAHFPLPKTADDWKPFVDQARELHLQYTGTSMTNHLTVDGWKHLAALFNECGRLSKPAGIRFCYHNHIREFEPLGGGLNGYDILLKECDASLVSMEMDIFWITYSGADPIAYWRRFPGRFPLLHIKDLKKGIKVNPREFPRPEEGNPFCPVGQGRIDWRRIFSHVHLAGTKYIFVEQDACDGSPLDAIRTSYKYLRNLRLA
ncbi:MAG: sugar phosphate isomerase/epimerase, partial [Acidobacteriota bacterium]|nr:sugar phosphate isomerase/epimerase [Acidobacteriota bacterium]